MDKETINEYNKHREYLINNMRNYIHGNLYHYTVYGKGKHSYRRQP